MIESPKRTWNDWNRGGGPNYPHEKVIQFCFRRYPEGSREGVRVLDLACGSGVHTVFLASEGFEVTGVDLSDVGVENTRRRLDELGLAANLHVASADAVDLERSHYDLVICVGLFDSAGFDVAAGAVERVIHAMRDGGEGLFLFASDRDYQVRGANPYDLHGFTESEVRDVFDVGFDRVWFDRYITTHEGGRLEENAWLVTVRK